MDNNAMNEKDFNLNLFADNVSNDSEVSPASFLSVSLCNSSTSVPCAFATNVTEGCSTC
jgi:hypothetical protein